MNEKFKKLKSAPHLNVSADTDKSRISVNPINIYLIIEVMTF